jgi:5-methylcytosine-specific restriction endonuclease McrA
VSDRLQDALRWMEVRDYALYLRELRRRERHSRRLAHVTLRDYDEDHPGHPLGRGMPPGAPFRLDESHTDGWQRVVRADPCAYCGSRPAGTVDHIVPRSEGRYGLHGWTNFAGACESCNGSKDSESLLAFLARRKGVRYRRRRAG